MATPSHIYNFRNEGQLEEADLRHHNLYNLIELLESEDLEKRFNNVKKINRKRLIDQINYLNFANGNLIIVFKHSRYDELLTIQAIPDPCQTEVLSCRIEKTGYAFQHLKESRFLCFYIEDGRKVLLARSEEIELIDNGLCIKVPEFCYEISSRKTKRYACPEIQAQVIQNGIIFSGHLSVFSIGSFQVEIFSDENSSLKWVNAEYPVQVILKKQNQILYTGECTIIKHSRSRDAKSLILLPSLSPIKRFKKREFRAPRQTLHPSPSISFLHPLIGKLIHLTICDLSTSGFSIEEEGESSNLLPGMIIPEIKIDLATATNLACRAQVVFRNPLDQNIIKCGLTILNMSTEEYIKLSNMVTKTFNNNLDVCGLIDLENLWNFFFETGFIYPKKYHYIQSDKEAFKQLYEKIYTGTAGIERHFTYQERGAILGHISMLHIYDTTWMLHHYATTPNSRHKRVGLTLLQQIERFIIDSHYIDSTKMDYMICFFRPDNKFPNLVFGGAARTLRDPQICSLDSFAYFNYPQALNTKRQVLPQPWAMTRTDREDLEELRNFYDHTSGGLMLQALNVQPGLEEDGSLSQAYHKVGLKRERHLLSIKKDGEVKAVINLLMTEKGLNLSELANCVSLIVLDPEDFPFEIFLKALSNLSLFDEREILPVLIYPVHYAQKHSLAYERIYNLWAFKVDNSDFYFKYINKIFSRLVS